MWLCPRSSSRSAGGAEASKSERRGPRDRLTTTRGLGASAWAPSILPHCVAGAAAGLQRRRARAAAQQYSHHRRRWRPPGSGVTPSFVTRLACILSLFDPHVTLITFRI